MKASRVSRWCAVVLLFSIAVPSVACVPREELDPARRSMRINEAESSTETGTPVSGPASENPGEDSLLPEAVPGQLLLTLVDGASIDVVVKRNGDTLLGSRRMPDGRYLVFVLPLVSDSDARAILAKDAAVEKSEYNREFPPSASGTPGAVPGGTTAGDGTLPPPESTENGVVGDTGTGGLNEPLPGQE